LFNRYLAKKVAVRSQSVGEGFLKIKILLPRFKEMDSSGEESPL